MTSLQRQLATIAANSTHQLDLKAQKAAHGKSLLFEPRIAASQDFNTIYQVCSEGFQELCMLDARFAAFSQNLFSEQSKSEERTQMTAEENKELNVVLESFLGLVGPRLLLKPAIKAVEWLVRRFRVHEYNTDFVILTFLPYHATPLFTTLLSILPRKVSPTFRFLHPYMTSLANLPRQTIIYTATNTKEFFTAFNTYVLKVAKAGQYSPALLSFWASITTQAVDGQLEAARSGRGNIQRHREEDLLLRVLPILNKALALKKIPELVTGSCMIMTILATKAHLEDKVLNGLMEALVASWTQTTLDSCLVTLSVLAQERQAAKLPKSVVRALLKIDDCGTRLISMASRCPVGRLAFGLLLGILDKLATSNQIDNLELVATVLEADLLSPLQTSIVIKSLLLAIGQMDESTAATPQLRDALATLLVRLSGASSTRHLIHSVTEEQKMNLDAIEMKLKTVIRPAEELPDTHGHDVEMVEATSTETMTPFDHSISALEGQQATEASFLQSTDAALFPNLSQAFLHAVDSDEHLEKLIALPVLAKDKALTRPTFISFFVRTWCGPYPALARSAALQVVTAWLSAHPSEQVDLQALIPYLISALADSSAGVRRAAAECTLVLARSYRDGGKDGKKLSNRTVWGSKALYGKSTESTFWLDPEQAAKFLSKVLVPGLEECVLDADHISQIVGTALSGKTRPGEHVSAIELKTSLRSAVCTFLSSHFAHSPLLIVRLRLIPILSRMGKTGTKPRVDLLLPALRQWLALADGEVKTLCQAENLEPSQVDREFLQLISAREHEGLLLLQSIMTGELAAGRPWIHEVAFERTKTLWSSLDSGLKQELGQFLLDLSLSGPSNAATGDRAQEAMDILRSVDLTTDVLSAFLDSLPSATNMADQPPAAKRRRTSKADAARPVVHDTNAINDALKRITLVLELVESSSPEKHPQLLRGLFHVLSELQHYKAQTSSSLVYLQSLAISCLLSIVDKLKHDRAAQVDRSVIRADLLVECVRSTSNPQVQNSAILLISSLATWVPDLVLHSVMPIFTFMGTTLLRQSDDYSAHVIDQTISRVVPPLVASLRKRNQDLVSGAAEILLSFTAAYEHIPLHRRLPLFVQLTKTLGPDETLFAVIAMLVDRYSTDNGVKSFITELMRSVEPLTQLRTTRRYLDLIEDSLRPKRTISEVILSFNEKDAGQTEEAIVHITRTLATLVKDPQLRSRLSRTLSRDDADAATVHQLFAELLEKTIRLLQRTALRSELREACTQVLSNLLGLLPVVDLIKSAETLLSKPDDEVRRVVLASLYAPIQRLTQRDERARAAVLEFLPRVTDIITTSSDVALKRTAVLCIDQIAEKFGKKDTTRVASAAEVVVSDHALGSQDDGLRRGSLLCLATAVEVMRPDEFIPLMPQALPNAFAYLEESIGHGEEKEPLHNAVYAFICAIIEHVPFMFSVTHLVKTLQLSYGSAVADLSEEADESRQQFYRLAVRQIDAKECFAAIERNWDGAVRAGFPALKEQIETLSAALARHPKSAIIGNAQTLFSLFLKAFDLRRTREVDGFAEEYDDSVLAAAEHLINEAAIAMTMKLNDAVFRPFFVRLVDWASKSLPKKDVKGRHLRATSLFVFLGTLFDKLKSIVTSYSTYVLDLAAEILQNNTSASEEILLVSVLTALSKSFDHDQDDFWQSPDHFHAICAPLLSQLTHPTNPAYTTTHVIPTLTAFATAASSAEHHKTLNSGLLKLLRHKEAGVRLAAVNAQKALTERLGEDWLALLPEMLPFISELQEDDDEGVERETLRWIKGIEEILGESLEGMLV
ncbi:snoRNA-binding rRNA-processing protein utp10 [Coniosporium apollinis]|uniref:U3 small nucleolar RNA-associated protein 10 n=1 Tax=Coniosporium apollinis TaxID=61459 RepID=A0ABQ9NVA1_9PEZI|nr:snoRNA-binding rRNA-processing protein utp10 [Coniosporium apollinis]